MKNQNKAGIVIGTAVILGSVLWGTSASGATLDFDGLCDREAVAGFYDGGLGGRGSGPGSNAGVTFSDNALALVTMAKDGSGYMANEPSPGAAMFFESNDAAVMSTDEGFDTGVAFYYTAQMNPGIVAVFDGPNCTGNVLAVTDLAVTPSHGTGNQAGIFDNWAPASVAFEGKARSVRFAGTPNFIAFDNITTGSLTAPAAVPEPGTMSLLGVVLLPLLSFRRKR